MTYAVKGWCPGALRPMPSGDGLIVRLRLPAGILPTALAREIADWSRRWGNGQIDLSNRANLQLRGVSDLHLPALRDAMAAAGLLDASPDAEAVRNVIASPLAGLDPDAVLDIRPVVHALERRLAEDATLHALPGKFGFAIDDGGRFGLDGVPADVRFVVRGTGEGGGPPSSWPCAVLSWPGRSPSWPGRLPSWPGLTRPSQQDLCGTGSLRTGLAGMAGSSPAMTMGRPAMTVNGPAMTTGGPPMTMGPPVTMAPTAHFDITLGDASYGPIAPDAVPDIAAALAHVLLDHPGVRRMTDLLAGLGPDEIARRAGLTRSTPRLHRSPTDPIGIHRLGDTACLGIGLPFGRISAEDLATLATIQGAQELRLTPWRAILIPLPNLEAARAVCDFLPPGTFIHDPADPRRRIAACPGAPACGSATTSTRDDALALIPRIANIPGTGIVLHVSGCDKGCAHPAPAPLTLVARHGRYHLIRNGTAADAGDLT